MFERGGNRYNLLVGTGDILRDATPADIAAVLDQHPEIAEEAGWVRVDRERVYRVVEEALMEHTCLRITADDGTGERMDLVDVLEDGDFDMIASSVAEALAEGSE